MKTEIERNERIVDYDIREEKSQGKVASRFRFDDKSSGRLVQL